MSAAPPARDSLLGQIARYAATGVINTLLGFAVIVWLHLLLGFGLVVSNVVGYAVGIAASFVLNRAWTFRHRGAMLPSMIGFLTLVGIAFAANLGAVLGLSRLGVPYLAAQAAGVLVYALLVFIGSRHVVFSAVR